VADQPEHLDFFDQIVYALVDMSESVDLPAGEMRNGCHQIFVFRTKGELIGESCRVNMRTKTGMFCDILYTFTVIVNDMMKILETLKVIFLGDNSFHRFLLTKSIAEKDMGRGDFSRPIGRLKPPRLDINFQTRTRITFARRSATALRHGHGHVILYL
jgi:hypothetical protein